MHTAQSAIAAMQRSTLDTGVEDWLAEQLRAHQALREAAGRVLAGLEREPSEQAREWADQLRAGLGAVALDTVPPAEAVALTPKLVVVSDDGSALAVAAGPHADDATRLYAVRLPAGLFSRRADAFARWVGAHFKRDVWTYPAGGMQDETRYVWSLAVCDFTAQHFSLDRVGNDWVLSVTLDGGASLELLAYARQDEALAALDHAGVASGAVVVNE